MDQILTEQEFLNLPDQEIVQMVDQIGKPKVVVLLPDTTRRTGIIYKRMKPSSPDFEDQLFVYLSPQFTDLSKIMYDQGLKTLFIPGFTHGNLKRGKQYVKAIINTGVKSILTEDTWLDFYKEYKVNVNIYGDFEYLKKNLNKKEYKNIVEWCDEIRKTTGKNKKRTFFWGFACSTTMEYERIAKLSIDYFKEFNKYPNRKELIKIYFGRHVDDVDIYIRPGEIRDSDCQPPIISGLSQFYFPIAPLTEINPNFYRRILYDYLFNRIITYSKKKYSDSDFIDDKLDILNKYYEENKDHIIGLGKKIGKIWVPQLDVKNPKLKKQK